MRRERWGWVLFALVGCTAPSPAPSPEPSPESDPEPSIEPAAAPVEPPAAEPALPSAELTLAFESEDCGPVVDLVERDARVFGVTGGGAGVCAFDLAVDREDLRVDRLRTEAGFIDGRAAQRLEGDATQLVAATWWEADSAIGVFERTRAGVKLLHREQTRDNRVVPSVHVGRRADGELAVVYTARTVTLGCSREPASIQDTPVLWIPGAGQRGIFLGDQVDRAVFADDRLLVAGTEQAGSSPLDSSSRCSDYLSVSQLRVAEDRGDEVPRDWESHAGAHMDAASFAGVLDALALADHWLVLAHCDGGAWLAKLSPKTGRPTWTAQLGTGTVGRIVSRERGGVDVALTGRLRSGRQIFSLRHVDADGREGELQLVDLPLDARVRVDSLALGDDGRVWLGAAVSGDDSSDTHAWLGVAELPG